MFTIDGPNNFPETCCFRITLNNTAAFPIEPFAWGCLTSLLRTCRAETLGRRSLGSDRTPGGPRLGGTAAKQRRERRPLLRGEEDGAMGWRFHLPFFRTPLGND